MKNMYNMLGFLMWLLFMVIFTIMIGVFFIGLYTCSVGYRTYKQAKEYIRAAKLGSQRDRN